MLIQQNSSTLKRKTIRFTEDPHWNGQNINEPHREKTGFLPMRKQRRRSASR